MWLNKTQSIFTIKSVLCNSGLWNRWPRGSGQWSWISAAAEVKLLNAGLSYSAIHLPTCNPREKDRVCVCVCVDNNLPLKAPPLSQQNWQDGGGSEEDGPLRRRPLEMTSEIKTLWWTTHRCLRCRRTWELRDSKEEKHRRQCVKFHQLDTSVIQNVFIRSPEPKTLCSHNELQASYSWKKH